MTSAPSGRATAEVRGARPRARRELWSAWIAVALIPLALVAGMFIGEGLISLQGFESGASQAAPLGPMLLAVIPALLVTVAPAVGAIWFGLRAHTLGVEAGLLPTLVGFLVLAYVVTANVASAVVGR
jgi:hypothetical protein